MEPSQRFQAVAKRVNNWGRWGPEDQLGTLNLIDEAARLRGVAAVRSGEAHALGLPLSADEGIQMGFIPGRTNPERTMIAVNNPLSDDPEWIASSEDVVTLALQCATHWDALAHVSYGGRLYNGFGADQVTEKGALRCGIGLVTSVVSRGVLLDVARARGQDLLDPGYAITPADLDAACALGQLTIEPGDLVLVRTGQMAHLGLDGGTRDLVKYTWPTPGLTIATAEWFFENDVAAVAIDTMTLEVYPCEEDGGYLPVHLLHLVEMGMTQGQNWVLDSLAAACAVDGRYSFLLDATPLPFTHALGSPVNPIALR